MAIKTSIIVPIYNTEQYLDECIQSVLNQTQKEIEIILVDDGSTDNSKEIIKKYEQKYSWVVALYQNNQKLGAARNAGVKVAHGKYVYFLDSDDYIAKDMLEQCYSYAEMQNLDFLCFDAHAFCENNVSISSYNVEDDYNRSKVGITDEVLSGKEYWLKYFRKGGVYTCAQLTYINREFFLQNQLYFRGGVFYEDNDWIARMYIAANRVGYLKQKLYYKRLRNNSITVGKYSCFHLISCMRNILFMKEILIKAEDFVAKSISSDVLKIMSACTRSIVENLRREQLLCSLTQELISFCTELASDKELLWQINKSAYVEVVELLEVFCRQLEGQLEFVEQLLSEIMVDKKKICSYWKKHFRLHEKINIGIYGTGKKCEKLLEWCAKQGIAITANIWFIDSHKTSGVYQGYPISNVEEIIKLNLDHILVASTRYRDEMIMNLKNMGVGEDRIFVVPDRFINSR